MKTKREHRKEKDDKGNYNVSVYRRKRKEIRRK